MRAQLLERPEELITEVVPPLPAQGDVPGRADHRVARRVAVAVLLGAGIALLGVLLYAASVHSAPGNSDGATVVLEGKALSGGNLTLKNWALSMDSFWLLDVPLYAVAILLGGVRPQLLHLVPTLVALGVICSGAWIARFGRRGWAGVLAAGAVVVMLGLPGRALAGDLLMGPLHVTTVLFCLLAFVALRRGGYGWGWLFAVGLLSVALLGDMQTVVLGMAPVCLAGTVRALRTRSSRAGAPAVLAGLASGAVAEVVRRVADALGSYSIAGANPIAPLHQMLVNLRGLVGYGAAVQGVGVNSFGTAPQPVVLEIAHGLGVALVLAAVAVAARSVLGSAVSGRRAASARSTALAVAGRRQQPGAGAAGRDLSALWIEDVLVFAFFGACAIYVSLTLVSSPVYDRYLTAVVIFGSILAGRLVGRLAERAGAGRAKAALVLAASLVAVGYLATFATDLGTVPPAQSSASLVRYLSAHHLTSGIGDYWSSSIVTVESSDAIQVRPVTTEPGTQYLGRYMRQTTSDWYGGAFEFFVYNTALPWNSVDAKTATASFGAPLHTASVGSYRVLTWGHALLLPGDGQYVKYTSAS